MQSTFCKQYVYTSPSAGSCVLVIFLFSFYDVLQSLLIRFIAVTLPCQHAAKEDTFNSVPAERHQKVLRQFYVPHSFQELESMLGFFLLTRLCVLCVHVRSAVMCVPRNLKLGILYILSITFNGIWALWSSPASIPDPWSLHASSQLI